MPVEPKQSIGEGSSHVFGWAIIFSFGFAALILGIVIFKGLEKMGWGQPVECIAPLDGQA